VTVRIAEASNVGVKVEMVGRGVMVGVKVCVGIGVLVIVGTGDEVAFTLSVTAIGVEVITGEQAEKIMPEITRTKRRALDVDMIPPFGAMATSR